MIKTKNASNASNATYAASVAGKRQDRMMVNEMTNGDSYEGPDIGPIERGARWIALLDHPFYDDERQRHIWYEASSIGLQLFLQLQLVVAAAAVWIGGDQAAVNYTAAFLGVLGVVSLAILAYTRFKQAEYLPTVSDYKKGPMVLYFTLVMIYGLGVARASGPVESPDLMTWLGIVVGLGLFVGLGALMGYLISRGKADGS